MANYKTISKLSSILKFFKSVGNDALVSHVVDLIPDAQYGFVKGRFCTSNLVLFTFHLAVLLEQPLDILLSKVTLVLLVISSIFQSY